MPVIAKKNTLRGLLVDEAQRKQVISLHHEQPLGKAISLMEKHKLNSILVADDNAIPTGVVSKTDLMAAYYASLPVDSPLNYIMSSPPLFCQRQDLLENALESMRSNKINCLYVEDGSNNRTTGIVSYADIVGLLYHYCHKCKLSKRHKVQSDSDSQLTSHYRACEIMDKEPVSLAESATLTEIMESLSGNRHGAVLLTDDLGSPTGMISKTDLISAFNRDIPADTPACNIMSKRLISCEENDYLEQAIRKMIVAEVQSLFVYSGTKDNITGILTLADTARVRSGSCHACLTSRIKVEKNH